MSPPAAQLGTDRPPPDSTNPLSRFMSAETEVRTPIDSGDRADLDQAAREMFGFDENIDRMAFLPFGKTPEGEIEFSWPGMLVQAAKSLLLPGRVVKGESFTADQVTEFALTFGAPLARTPSVAKARAVKAPSGKELARRGGELFDTAENANFKVKADSYVDNLAAVESRLVAEGFDPDAHPALATAINVLSKKIGKDVTARDLKIAREHITDVFPSPKAKEGRLAVIARDQLDEFIDNIKLDDLAVGSIEEAKSAAIALKNGRRLWHISSKMGEVSRIVEVARNSASGFENGLRSGFRSLLNSQRRLRGFTTDEIEVMRRIVRGTVSQNLLKLTGKLAPTNLIGGSIGIGGGAILGGPVGAMAVPLAGGAAKVGASRAAGKTVDTLQQTIFSGQRQAPPQRIPRAAPRAVGPAVAAEPDA